MSNEPSSLMESLESIRNRYRRQSLEDRLEDVAADLRDIKLQLVLMDELFGTDLSIDEELLDQVSHARKAVEAGDYGTLAESIDDLEEMVSDERSDIETSLNKKLASYQQEVQAMERLNEELDVFPSSRLTALQTLLESWNWKEAALVEELSDFESQMAECRDVGQEMATIRDEAQTEIIEPLADEGIEDIVRDILSSGSIYLSDLSSKERDTLANSDLGEAIVLSLG